MKKLIILLLILMAAVPTTSVIMQLTDKAEAKYDYSLSSSEVELGDIVTYKVKVSDQWLNILKEPVILPEIDHIMSASDIKVKCRNFSFTKHDYEISFDLLAYAIPEASDFTLKLNFQNYLADHKTLRITLPLFKVKADLQNEGKVEASDLIDNLSTTYSEKTSSSFIGVTVAAVLITCLFLTALIVWLKIRKAKVVIIPPWDTANAGLNEVSELLPMNESKFFVMVSDIIRAYIEAIYQLPATESTTKEFLIKLQNSERLGDEVKKILSNFLKEADMVKFARQPATEEHVHDTLNSIKELVSVTSQEIINREAANV